MAARGPRRPPGGTPTGGPRDAARPGARAPDGVPKRARKPPPIDPAQPLVRRPAPPPETRPTPVVPTYAVAPPRAAPGNAGKAPRPATTGGGGRTGSGADDKAGNRAGDGSGVAAARAQTVRRSEQGRHTAEAFGRRVAEYREGLGWSQAELARRTRLTQAAISHVEAGTRTPSIETARVLAHALGVSVGALMGERSAAVLGEEGRFLALWRSAAPRVQAQVARFLRFCLAEARTASRPPDLG